MKRRGVRALLAGLALCALASSARADDATEAAQLIEQGIALRQGQHDLDALALFEKAQSLSPTARGEAQVALADQALGRWGPAETHLLAAMAATGDPWIDSRRQILGRALEIIRDHLGDVELTGATEGDVYIDGVLLGARRALRHLRIEAGRRALEVRAAKRYPFSRFLDVRARETVRVEVEEGAPLFEPPAPPTPALVATTAVPPPTTAPPVAIDAGRSQRTIGLVFLGGAGLFVATGAVGLLERQGIANTFNADPTCTGTPSNQLSQTCRDRLNDGNTWQTIGIVGFVGGGLVGALSAVLLVTAPSSSSPRTTWRLPCAPIAGGAACGVEGTF